MYYNQPYKCMQKHWEEFFSQFAFNQFIKSKWNKFLYSVLQQNNISPIFSIENILFA